MKSLYLVLLLALPMICFGQGVHRTELVNTNNAILNTVASRAASSNALFIRGPASATDHAIMRYDLTTGKLAQNSGVLISDANNITGVQAIDVVAINITGPIIQDTGTGTADLGTTTVTTLGATTITAGTLNIQTINIDGALTQDQGTGTAVLGGTEIMALSVDGETFLYGPIIGSLQKSGNGTLNVASSGNTASNGYTIATNASFTLTLSGPPAHGQQVSLTVSNYALTTDITMTVPNFYDFATRSVVTSFLIASNSKAYFGLRFNTNFVGAGQWELLQRFGWGTTNDLSSKLNHTDGFATALTLGGSVSNQIDGGGASGKFITVNKSGSVSGVMSNRYELNAGDLRASYWHGMDGTSGYWMGLDAWNPDDELMQPVYSYTNAAAEPFRFWKPVRFHSGFTASTGVVDTLTVTNQIERVPTNIIGNTILVDFNGRSWVRGIPSGAFTLVYTNVPAAGTPTRSVTVEILNDVGAVGSVATSTVVRVEGTPFFKTGYNKAFYNWNGSNVIVSFGQEASSGSGLVALRTTTNYAHAANLVVDGSSDTKAGITNPVAGNVNILWTNLLVDTSGRMAYTSDGTPRTFTIYAGGATIKRLSTNDMPTSTTVLTTASKSGFICWDVTQLTATSTGLVLWAKNEP